MEEMRLQFLLQNRHLERKAALVGDHHTEEFIARVLRLARAEVADSVAEARPRSSQARNVQQRGEDFMQFRGFAMPWLVAAITALAGMTTSQNEMTSFST